jgi:hypothetical protein
MVLSGIRARLPHGRADDPTPHRQERSSLRLGPSLGITGAWKYPGRRNFPEPENSPPWRCSWRGR